MFLTSVVVDDSRLLGDFISDIVPFVKVPPPNTFSPPCCGLVKNISTNPVILEEILLLQVKMTSYCKLNTHFCYFSLIPRSYFQVLPSRMAQLGFFPLIYAWVSNPRRLSCNNQIPFLLTMSTEIHSCHQIIIKPKLEFYLSSANGPNSKYLNWPTILLLNGILSYRYKGIRFR